MKKPIFLFTTPAIQEIFVRFRLDQIEELKSIRIIIMNGLNINKLNRKKKRSISRHLARWISMYVSGSIHINEYVCLMNMYVDPYHLIWRIDTHTN